MDLKKVNNKQLLGNKGRERRYTKIKNNFTREKTS